MSALDITIIVVATLIGVAYLIKIRSYDIYEMEPFSTLLFVAILGGVVSIFTSFFLYAFFNVEQNFVDAIIKIGVIEELSKLFALILIYYFIKNNFNEIVDGIIYITAISLGFAVIENIFYAFSSEYPFLLLFKRSIFSVMGHISFSGYMGVAFYIHKRVQENYLGIIISVLIAALAHGLYDAVIFHQELIFLFNFIFVGLVFLQFWLLKTTLSFSKFREELNETTFKETENSITLHCNLCTKSLVSKELSFWKIKGGMCDSCNSIVFNSANVTRLLKYFRPILKPKKILKDLSNYNQKSAPDSGGKIYYNHANNTLIAKISDLGLWFKEGNFNDRKYVLEMPFFGYFLKQLGLKYL
jgi:RsiW-degrading membrane proteinase PrsW (M82 family)